MIAEHFSAVRTRLSSGTPALNVYDSARIDNDGAMLRETYAILFGGTPDVLDDGRMTAPQSAASDAEYVYTVRSVSINANGVRTVQSLALARLSGFIPVISGRACGPMALISSSDPRPDNTAKPPMFYADDEYSVHSSRA